MLIVGVNTKLRRTRHEGRTADTWWLNLSPVTAQLFPAGGHDMIADMTVAGRAIHITWRPRQLVAPPDGYDPNLGARLWIAEDLTRGTLRLPAIPEFRIRNTPDVIEGFLSVYDPDPDRDPAIPRLMWEGAAD